MKNIFYIIALIAVFFSCKTDFEINAPYEKIPIIYGVLDQSVDTQFIKINKSFLGTDNLSYASVNDSQYFNNVEVKIEELDKNENIGRVFSLQTKMVPVKPGSGIFFTGEQRVYYFVPSTPLDEEKEYRIVGNGDGKDFSARTNLISDFGFANTFRNSTNNPKGITLYNGTFVKLSPAWRQTEDASFYDVFLRLNYEEHRNGTVTNNYIDWKMGSRNPKSSNQDLVVEANTESFFVYLSNNSQLQDTVGVTKRVIKTVDFRVTSSSVILKTYIDVNKPSNSIAFDKPDYTNIVGGRGVFASRYTSKIEGKKITEKSIEYLWGSALTSDFKFCTDESAYSGQPFYCP